MATSKNLVATWSSNLAPSPVMLASTKKKLTSGNEYQTKKWKRGMKLQEKYKETSRNQGMEEEAPVTHFSKIKTFIGNRSGFHELWRNG